jgi:hypothetical protein
MEKFNTPLFHHLWNLEVCSVHFYHSAIWSKMCELFRKLARSPGTSCINISAATKTSVLWTPVVVNLQSATWLCSQSYCYVRSDSRQWAWRMSSGMLRHVARIRTDVSEERIASIIRLTRINVLGTLTVTSNRREILCEPVARSERYIFSKCTTICVYSN